MSIRLFAVIIAVSACAKAAKPVTDPGSESGSQTPPIGEPAVSDAAPQPPPTFRLEELGDRTEGDVEIQVMDIDGDKAHVAVLIGDTGTSEDLTAGQSYWYHGIEVEVVEVGQQDVELRVGLPKPVQAGSGRRLELAKGETKPLSDGWKIRFVAHSHKHVSAGGPSSPLITYIEYVPDDGDVVEEQINLRPPEESTWWRQNVRIDQLAHEYDSWIEIEIHELVLEYLK